MYMKNQFKKQFPSFLLETRNCFSLLSSYIIFQYLSLQEHQYNLMIPVSKGQKAVRACTIRLLNLGHAKYEVQNIQWMFVLHRPKRSVNSSYLRSKSADFEYLEDYRNNKRYTGLYALCIFLFQTYLTNNII